MWSEGSTGKGSESVGKGLRERDAWWCGKHREAMHGVRGVQGKSAREGAWGKSERSTGKGHTVHRECGERDMK